MKLPSVLFKGLTNWGRDPINADFYPDGDSLQFLATYKVCSGASAPADGDADFKHQVEYGSGTFTTETATVIPLKSINYKDYHNGAPSLVRTRKNAQRRNFIVKKNFPLFHQVDRVDEQFDSSLIAVLHRFELVEKGHDDRGREIGEGQDEAAECEPRPEPRARDVMKDEQDAGEESDIWLRKICFLERSHSFI